ncbi:LysR family transcriptional regulator [Pokkaliibacter sp. CJK22405]|uniref:LysR family transcriptional regulator n=1 Tax=Pokkaliibacter sp. CJK22405 TaxID=3384615 RepID=UPI0039849D81
MDRLGLIQVFVDIQRYGSLANVARQRGVAPSAITQALQQLEAEVGTNLMIRTTRRLSLTPEGDQFLADCLRLLEDYDRALERLSQAGNVRGNLRITSTNDFGRTRLPGLIDAFLKQHPEVRIELVLSDGVADLVEDQFDLALRTGPLTDSRFLCKRLISTRRLVCASPRYWQQHGVPAHPTELMQHNCLVLERPGDPQSQWHFSQQQKSFSVRVRGDRTASDGGVLRQWAMDDAGVVLKSAMDVAADIAAGRLQAVLDEYTHHEVNVYAIYPARDPMPQRLRLLIDFLQENLQATLGPGQ